MRFCCGVLVVTVLLFAANANGQGPWAKKEWKQWSKDDCRKVLEDSPWARRWVQSDSKMANFATRTAGTEGVGSESDLAVYYIVQLRSALPIRQAVARQALIENRYDSLEPEQKEALEKQVEGFLNRSYDDVIVVHIVYGSNVLEYNRELSTFWTHYPEGTVPQEALLHGSKGQKISPLRLVAPNGAQEFELIFPRMVGGKPLLEVGDKSLAVEFASPAIGKVGSSRVYVEFKVDKMQIESRLIY